MWISLIDLPNVLIIEISDERNSFLFSTTRFVGDNDEWYSKILLHKMSIDASTNSLEGVNLFPYKLNNLHGREVSLAIFNYNPYTLWKVVVNKKEQLFKSHLKMNWWYVPLCMQDNEEDMNSRELKMKKPLSIDGTEGWVFLEFCKKFNCSSILSCKV